MIDYRVSKRLDVYAGVMWKSSESGSDVRGKLVMRVRCPALAKED
jgi:hypothetical protein